MTFWKNMLQKTFQFFSFLRLLYPKLSFCLKNIFKVTSCCSSKDNKRRSRTAILCVNVEHKRLIQHTTNHVNKKPELAKINLKEIFFQVFKPVALGNYEFQNQHSKKNQCFFASSAYQLYKVTDSIRSFPF